MNAQTPSSTTVLTGHATLGGRALTEEAGATQGDQPGRGSAPPPPHAGNVSDPKLAAKLAAQEAKEIARRRKELRNQVWLGRLRSVHRTHWYAIAGVGVAAVGFIGLKSLLGTMLDIAEARSGEPAATVTTEPAPVVVQGIENPLELVDLSTQARWKIGVDQNNKLVPIRSTAAVAELLSMLDLCSMYIVQHDDASVSFLAEPAAGADKLMADGACTQPTTPTTVETFVDPAPTTVPGA